DKVFDNSLEALVDQHPQSKDIQKLRREVLTLRKQAKAFKRNFGSAEREQRKALYREARQVVGTIKELEQYVIDSIIGTADVVCATLVGASNRELNLVEFHTVVIDEAGQSLEPLCWIPILRAKKVVLAGDPHQLPPTVKSPEAHRQGLSKTLLEKVIDKTDSANLLTTQYRMNKAIMAFSNEEFYEGKLIAHDSVADHSLDELPVEFVDTAGCGFDEKMGESTRSRFNPGEIDILRSHREASGIQAPTAIISPYREQVLQLIDACMSEGLTTVNTVDSFQGQERDVVYISLVRSNEKAEIGFLKDYRRMNVAMTRARKKLVVIGDSATIGQDQFYARFIDYCEANGFYRSAWEFMSV
ncbi:MAG: AAA family ATPase, partial [Flavobacteriales bacterium]|nr:AAA family ATPase [Flavobacteriales bacterium]